MGRKEAQERFSERRSSNTRPWPIPSMGYAMPSRSSPPPLKSPPGPCRLHGSPVGPWPRHRSPVFSLLRALPVSVFGETAIACRFHTYPKCTHHRTPRLLSSDEVSRLIGGEESAGTRDLHGALLHRQVTKRAGVLRIGDVDSERMVIHIRKGKGGKDRIPVHQGARPALPVWVAAAVAREPRR